MKKRLLLLLVACLPVPCLFAEIRLDMGVTVPWEILEAHPQEFMIDQHELYDFGFLIPIPEGGLYWAFGEGPLTFGVGTRFSTVVLVSVAVLSAFVEYDIGPLAIEGHLSGVVGASQVGTDTEAVLTPLVIPEFSAWMKVTDFFRIGAGVITYFDFQPSGKYRAISFCAAKFSTAGGGKE